MSSFEIKCVADAIEIVKPEKPYLSDPSIPRSKRFPHGIWFRGQSNVNKRLLPNVFRLNDEEKLIYDERNMFYHFQLKKNDYRQTYISTFEWLCLMQHYGLPTRLLDWTESILVALFFAVNDKNKDPKEYHNNNAAIFAVRSSKLNALSDERSICIPESIPVILRAESVLENDIYELLKRIKCSYSIGKVIYERLRNRYYVKEKNWNELIKKLSYPVAVYPGRLNNRMCFQESVFTIHAGCFSNKKSSDWLPESLGYLNSELPIEKQFLKTFIIPKKYKIEIKKELNRLGIHEGTLFPELEHQTSHIKEKWIL